MREKLPAPSMEETISGWMVLIGLASMLLTAILVGVMFTRALGDQLLLDLGRQARTLAAALELAGEEADLAGLAGGDVRLTLLEAEQFISQGMVGGGIAEFYTLRDRCPWAVAAM